MKFSNAARRRLMAGTDVANGLDSNQTEKVVILAAAEDFDSS